MAIRSGGALGGIWISPVLQLEAETVTYFAAMDVASELYWPAEKLLVDNLIKSLKYASLWDRATLLWIPVGASLSGAMRALKHPMGVGTVMANNGFTSDKWDRLSGLDSRNTSFWIDTLTSESDYAPATDTHMAVSIKEALAPNNSREMGFVGTPGSDRFHLMIKFSGASGTFYRSFSQPPIENIATPEVVGVHVATLKSNVSVLCTNSTVRYSSGYAASINTPTAGSIGIFRAMGNDSNKRMDIASIGKGLTQAEALQYSSILQTARTQRASLVAP